MDLILIAVVAVVLLVLGLFGGIFIHKSRLNATFEEAQKDSERILAEAHEERQQIIKEANLEIKEENKKLRSQFENEFRKRRSDIDKLENKIKQREQALEKKLSILDKKEKEYETNIEQLSKEEANYKRLVVECEKNLDQHNRTLERISQLSREEAKEELINSMAAEAKVAAKETIKQIEEDARKEGEHRAQSMVSLAVQRVSSEYVNDSTVTVVGLPNDEMKGRIIGREGRNIRALEQATGIDLIIDDTPEAVILSCFNPVRREIARITLERLIADGRIHPARIEETVKRVRREFDQIILDVGEQAAFDAGITDLNTELLMSLGRLKYRTSGQQTVLQHSVEVAHISGIMAAELGADIKKAKRAGLLHDIGKAVDQEVEGHHSRTGAELCKKHREAGEVVEAVANHHAEDLTHASPLTVIVHAANILSENRPGARREILESYVKRLQDMESIVNNFNGIESSYVIQAGREIRAVVTPTGVNDDDVVSLSQDIAFELRKEMTFPGQVKVTVVRESKYMEYAK